MRNLLFNNIQIQALCSALLNSVENLIGTNAKCIAMPSAMHFARALSNRLGGPHRHLASEQGHKIRAGFNESSQYSHLAWRTDDVTRDTEVGLQKYHNVYSAVPLPLYYDQLSSWNANSPTPPLRILRVAYNGATRTDLMQNFDISRVLFTNSRYIV